MDMNSDMITAGFKKSWDVFIANAGAYLVAFVIVFIVSMFSILLIPIILLAPLTYGFSYMAVKGLRGDKVEVGDLFIALKSVSLFIRSWMYLIIPFVIAIVIGILISILMIVLVQIEPALAFLFYMICWLIGMILMIILIPIFFYALYIYVMTPSKGVIYAYKESFALFKANTMMTIITIVVVFFLGYIPIIGNILGMLFTVYVLKEIKPDLADNASFD